MAHTEWALACFSTQIPPVKFHSDVMETENDLIYALVRMRINWSITIGKHPFKKTLCISLGSKDFQYRNNDKNKGRIYGSNVYIQIIWYCCCSCEVAMWSWKSTLAEFLNCISRIRDAVFSGLFSLPQWLWHCFCQALTYCVTSMCVSTG